MDITIPVYSEQALTPRASQVLRAIVDDTYPEHNIKFTMWMGTTGKVLTFGKLPPEQFKYTEFISTYSIAQVMSKANAASVVASALRRFITVPDRIPFDHVAESVDPFYVLKNWDFDAPTAIDIETDGNLGKTHTADDVNVISVALYQPGKRPVVFMRDYSSVWKQESKVLSPRQLEELAIVLPKFTKAIYHNGKFDTRVLNRVLGVELHVWFDTMLAHHVLNHAAGAHGLKFLAQLYLSAPEWEFGLSNYTKGGGHYELIPGWKLRDYNGFDVYWTWKLAEFFGPQIVADDDNVMAFNFEMAAARFLLDVENYGIPFSYEYARELGAEQHDHMATAKLALQMQVGNDFNPGSPQQVKRWVESQRYSIGSTNVEGLEDLKARAQRNGDGHIISFCDNLLAYRKASKIKGTYVDGWYRTARKGRVHPTFLVHGTSTGRLSSTQPNAQNVPRDKKIRKLVQAHG